MCTNNFVMLKRENHFEIYTYQVACFFTTYQTAYLYQNTLSLQPCNYQVSNMFQWNQMSCQKHKIGSLLLSSRYKTNYINTCSFLHAHFSGTMKVVENLSRKASGETFSYWKDIYCRCTLGLYMLLKIMKLVLSLHLNLVPCPLSCQF